MIKFINDDALIINKRDFGEADRYITVFTENFGKQTFLLKGIRKSKKRETNSIDILSLTKFSFYKKGESFTVSNFIGIDSYLDIKSDLEKLGIALYFMALLNSILVENNRKKSLYTIVIKSLDTLKESNDIRKNYILVSYFLYYLIKDEGLKIDIGRGNYFSFEKSKFIEENERYTYRISDKEKNIVEKFVSGRVKEIINSDEDLKDIKNTISLFEKYVNFHLGIDIKLKNYMMEG